MKKILYIVTALDAGGEEGFLLDIFPLLSKQFDHVVCPLIHAGEFYPDNQKIKLENSKNNPFWLWLFKSKTWLAKMLKPAFWIYYVLRINHILKNEKPDAVITCTPDSSFSLSMHELFTFGRRKKYTWYYRIGTHFYPSGYLPPFFRNNMTRSLMEKPMTKIGTYLMKLRIKQADQFIVVNKALKQELIASHNINTKNIFHLPVSFKNKPVNTQKSIATNTSFIFDTNKHYFIAAGRLKYVKGFDFLINAIAPLLKERQDIMLIILGDGPEKSRLEKQVKQLNLEEKILLPGFFPYPTKLIQNPIAYIVPSRSEGFGKLIIEAMNTHSIVIASNCSGPTEIIKDNIDGALFEREDCLSLRQVVKKILAMPDDQVTLMKENAYQKSLLFTTENITQQLNTKLESDLL